MRVGEIMPPLSRQQHATQTETDTPGIRLPFWLETGDNPRRKLQIVVAHSTARFQTQVSGEGQEYASAG
jgi:hypothetical protein